MAALKTILTLLSLGARAHGAFVSEPSPRVNDVTLNLEPVLTGGFQVVFVEGNERRVFGHVGRTLVSPFIVEDVDGGVAVTIGSTNLTINTLYDEGRQARAIKFRWIGDVYTRLEDCIDFGKGMVLAMAVLMLLKTLSKSGNGVGFFRFF